MSPGRRLAGVAVVLALVLSACLGGGPTYSAETTGAALVNAHQQAVTDRESVTKRLRWQLRLGSVRTNETVRTSHHSVTKFAFGNGSVSDRIRYRERSEATLVAYRQPRNGTYARRELGSDVRYLGPESGSPILNRRLATSPNHVVLFRVLDTSEFSLQYHGEGRRGNVSGHVFTRNSTRTGLGAFFPGVTLEPASEASQYRLVLVAGDQGLLRYARFELTGAHLDYVYTLRFTNHGSTTVSPPPWLPEAKRAVADRKPTDVVTVERSLAENGTRFVFRVTGQRRTLRTNQVELRPNHNPVLRNSFLNASRVGPVVVPYWPRDDSQLHNVTVVVHYDEAAVPGGNEEALTLVRPNRTTQRPQPIETTVSPTKNRAVATLSSRAEGNPLFLQQRQRYVQLLTNRTRS